MSLLLTLGFERQEFTSERFIVQTGSVQYSTDVAGYGSEGSLNVDGDTLATKPYYSVYESWLFFRIKRNSGDGARIGISDGTTELLLNFDGTTLSVTVAGVEVASAEIVSDDIWHSYHVHTNTYFEDEYVKVYMDGDLENPIIDFSTVNEWGFSSPGLLMVKGEPACDYLLDDIVVMDPTDAVGLVDVNLMKNPTIKAFLATDNGEKATQTSGDYTDIDFLPPNFFEKLEYSGIGQESTFVPEPLVSTDPILAKTVWERHLLNSIYYGSQLQLEVSVDGGDEIYSPDRDLLEVEFLSGEQFFGVEYIFEEGVNGPYNLESFNGEEFGWKLAGAVDTTEFCPGMSYLKYYAPYLGSRDVFVFACEAEVEGTTPVEIWINEFAGEGVTPINFDTPVGDSSKINFVDVGGKHFVQTDKSGGLESFDEIETTGDTTQIYGSFVIRNVPATTQLVFAIGNNVNSFSIKAKSDQTLEVSGVASSIPYDIDKVYVFYAYSSGIDEAADSIFILDDTEYVCTIDHFETTGEKGYVGSSGAVDGVKVDHIMYFMANRTEEEGPVDLGYFFLFTDLITNEYEYEPGFGPDVFPDYELGLFVYSGGVEALYETPLTEPIDWLYLDLQLLLPAMAAR